MGDYVINGTSEGRDQNLSFSPTTIMTKRHSKRVPQRKFQNSMLGAYDYYHFLTVRSRQTRSSKGRAVRGSFSNQFPF